MEKKESAAAEPRWTSHALEWGIGSIFFGLLVVFLIPLAILLGLVAAEIYTMRYYMSENDIGVAFSLGLLIDCLLMLPAGLGLWFGVRGLRQAKARSLPAGIPATGVALCSLTLGILVVALVVILLFRQGALNR